MTGPVTGPTTGPTTEGSAPDVPAHGAPVPGVPADGAPVPGVPVQGAPAPEQGASLSDGVPVPGAPGAGTPLPGGVPLPEGTLLPDAPVPAGEYAAARVAGGLVFTAGFTPRAGGAVLAAGILGAGLSVEDARPLAALAAERAVTAAREAAAEAGVRLGPALSLTVHLAATPGFTGHSRVADGAGARLRALLPGPPPARTAVGVASLPSGAPVEVTLVLATEPGEAAPESAGPGET
ncbi:RidA family protein [Streptomyces sp. NPDC093085]|uniref:RidA family protein n=1 Tax=Streptomyces sp. NPDC093085 TaxID=3155068 RepID=UPI00342108B0